MLRLSKSCLFSLLTICSPLTAMKASEAKTLMAKHKAILQQQKTLSLNKLSESKRHKLLVTAYDVHEEQMFDVYLNDWAIKQCAQSNHITDVQDSHITVQDIEKHLKKARVFKFPAPLYRAIGQRMADFYLIPYIQKHAKKINTSMRNELKSKVNQSMALVLMYAYDTQRNNHPTLEFPKESLPNKLLRKFTPETLHALEKIFNFNIV